MKKFTLPPLFCPCDVRLRAWSPKLFLALGCALGCSLGCCLGCSLVSALVWTPAARADLEFSGSPADALEALPLLRHQLCPSEAAGYRACELLAVRVIGDWAWVSWRREQKSGSSLLRRAALDWQLAYANGGTIGVEDAIRAGIVREVAEFLIPTPALDLADTNARLLPADLENLSAWDLRIARNAIFARHGRSFMSRQLSAYFRSWPWYHPDPDYSPVLLSETERANALIILETEMRKGYYPVRE